MYRIVCKNCEAIHGYSQTPVAPNMPTTCESCGKQKISVEPVRGEKLESLEFDIFIVNKRTNETKHNGFYIKAEEMESKNQQEVRDIFITKVATALTGLVTNESIANLIRGA